MVQQQHQPQQHRARVERRLAHLRGPHVVHQRELRAAAGADLATGGRVTSMPPCLVGMNTHK
jgi:hypothetical protein